MRIWIFAAFLVVWGILLHPLIGATAVLPGGSVAFVLAGAILVAISLVVARSLALDARALGLGRSGALRGAAVGAAVAAVISLVALALTRLGPLVTGQPASYGPLADVNGEQLARHIALFLPFGAVVPEEVAFRGTLLGALVARMDARRAVTLSAVTFALWHTWVASVTVRDAALGPPSPLFLPALAGFLLVVFAGGVFFAGLRLATGTLASTVAAHWVFNAVILIGLWTGQAQPPPSA